MAVALGPVVSANAELDGITTLVWGTGGALQAPLPPASTTPGGYAGEGYYIVDNVNANEKAEQIYGENGTGIECWRMTLKHGKRWNITVTDDSTMAVPSVNTTVTVLDYLGDKTRSYVAKVLSNDYQAARKQPGQRVLLVESLLLVDTQPA